VHSFVNKFATNHVNVFLITWIIYSTLCMFNLKCLLHMCSHWVVRDGNSEIYPTSNVAYKFARFEFIGLQ